MFLFLTAGVGMEYLGNFAPTVQYPRDLYNVCQHAIVDDIIADGKLRYSGPMSSRLRPMQGKPYKLSYSAVISLTMHSAADGLRSK